MPSLNLNAIGATEESKWDDMKETQEQSIQITFKMDDGRKVMEQFKKGQTVMLLKAYLSNEQELEDVTLMLGEKKLMDPMTLNDYEECMRKDSVEIAVHQRGRECKQ